MKLAFLDLIDDAKRDQSRRMSHSSGGRQHHSRCLASAQVLRNSLAFVVERGNHDGDATNTLELSKDRRWLFHLPEPGAPVSDPARRGLPYGKPRRVGDRRSVQGHTARTSGGNSLPEGEAQGEGKCRMEI